MEKLDLKTTAYNVGDGFCIDIVETDDLFEAWIYHIDYGIKEYMFGSLKSDKTDYGVFVSMARNEFDDYRDDYYSEYMDGDDGVVYGEL